MYSKFKFHRPKPHLSTTLTVGSGLLLPRSSSKVTFKDFIIHLKLLTVGHERSKLRPLFLSAYCKGEQSPFFAPSIDTPAGRNETIFQEVVPSPSGPAPDKRRRGSLQPFRRAEIS
eukprot:TRINITY_DN3021_c0_g2_i2.p1 TRINITY_DN3021_c0_g2~~TRINITY_DN3021_c0_g2_i2.p1  ORF type:complete len:116 (-),score=4.90 TRINITY_DN3021_c0_g2_i2:393-740(-)